MVDLKPIGVIGGMGPQATAYFMERLITLTETRDDQDHVPLYVDMKPQIPSRLSYLLDGTGDHPGPVLGQMAKGLEAQGAKALVMPCNTAHHYAEFMTEAVDIPLLNMLTLAADAMVKIVGEGGTVGMLASPATDSAGIFQTAFDRLGCMSVDNLGDKLGVNAIYPKDAERVLKVIRQIKAEGPSVDMASELTHFGQELEARGATCLLIGCSEFSIIGSGVETDLPLRDTVDILARETIRFSGAKLKE
ncbi:MAG: amino acid racemase [Maricaulaceae bacterium]